jgi:hypothetical protein
MTDNDFVVIATYSNNFEADIMKSALQAVGIQSSIQKDDCGGFGTNLSLNGGINLLVQFNDGRNAEEVLNSALLRPVNRTQATRCRHLKPKVWKRSMRLSEDS